MTARLPWPHSVRARLVSTYTLIAILLAAAGMTVFAVLLHRGVTASLDATLSARSAPLISTLRAPGLPDPLDTGAAGGRAGPTLDSFTAVYRPDGTVAELQPLGLPAPPVSAVQVASARARRQRFTVTVGDERLRVLATPVARADGTWVVAVAANLSPATEAADAAIHQLELTVPFLIALAALGAWLLSGAALRPVERMRADADNLGAHDPANRLTVPATADELARLSRTFNALLDRLHRSLGRQRDLIADAGHELRTPLAVLRTELELADGPGRSRDDLLDSIAHARSEVERLSKLAEDLLFLARADSTAPIVEPEQTDVSAVVADTARANRARAETHAVTLDIDTPERLLARADPAAVRRALDNLVANAFAATEAGGTITLAARQVATDTVITVSDTGPGFPRAFLAHAFGRFTRPDSARATGNGGSGLGLAIVAEIVDAHHGTVTAANNPDRGATVTMTLPPDGRPSPRP